MLEIWNLNYMEKEVFELEIGGKTLKVKTTDWTPQSSGSCLVSYGETEVIANVVMSNKNIDDMDYFPLTVEY